MDPNCSTPRDSTGTTAIVCKQHINVTNIADGMDDQYSIILYHSLLQQKLPVFQMKIGHENLNHSVNKRKATI